MTEPPSNLPIKNEGKPLKEFLKREEIKTMEKDISRLREIEARQEKERIAAIKPSEKIQAPPALPALPTFPTPPVRQSEGISLPKSNLFRKTLFRGFAIFLGFLVLGGLYWLFAPKEIFKKAAPAPASKIAETPPAPPPPALIPVIDEKTVSWGFRSPTAVRTIDTIIIHSTYNTLGGDLYDVEKIIKEHQIYKVAVHYLISREGVIYRLAPDEAIAYHAGSGVMPDGSRKNIINNFSIGVELVYGKTESPNEAQYESLAQIVKYLKQKYNIPFENILGANQISPGRKDNPWNFDREKLNSLIK